MVTSSTCNLEQDSVFRNLLDCVAEAIVVFDEQQAIVFANSRAEQLFGFQRAKLLGQSVDVLIPERFRNNCVKKHRAHLRGLSLPAERKIHLKHKDDSEVPVIVSFSPMKTKQGACVTAAIMETKRLEDANDGDVEELARSNEELESFAYVAAHDLRAPLRQIKTFVELLECNNRDHLDAEADEFMGYIKLCTDQMQALVDGLLEHARVGQQRENLQLTDCSTIVDELLAILDFSLHEIDARVTRDDLPTVMADRIQLAQLFQNLLTNSISYRSERPLEIHIGVKACDSDWLFSVRDNGIGIDPKFNEDVFDVFWRRHDGSGAGIGLATCKKIVESHNGHIWVESRPGKGSTFFFTLPT